MKFLVFSVAFLVANISCQDVYQIGTGIADITGPAADIGMVRIYFHLLSLTKFSQDGLCKTRTRYGGDTFPFVQ